MPAPPMRALLGFVAAVISVLIFHQAMWAALHSLALPGLTMPAPYPTDPIPPLGIPRIVNLCFWGGLYGLVYGLLLPKLTMPPWLSGLVLGVVAALVLWFIVAPIKGRPLASGWVPRTMVVVLTIHAVWGIGVGLIMQMATARIPQRV